MRISRRSLIQGSAALALAAALPARAQADDDGKQLTPEQALQKLRDGNASFHAEKLIPYRIDKKFREELAAGQKPFATIVCCSDSRAAPEQIFQAGLGQLFVVRSAGNTTAAFTAMGSIEYSAAKFGVPLIVVLGHTRCGAVDAADEIVRDHIQLPGSMQAMVEPIVPAAIAAHADPRDTVYENVRRVTARLRSREQPILFPLISAGKLRIVGAVYDLKEGEVDFFDLVPPAQA